MKVYEVDIRINGNWAGDSKKEVYKDILKHLGKLKELEHCISIVPPSNSPTASANTENIISVKGENQK